MISIPRSRHQRGFEQVEAIVGGNPLFGAVAVNAEDAPEREPVGAHPLWGEAAREAFAGIAHLPPSLFINDRSPRAPGCWPFEQTQLSRAHMKTGEQEPFQAGNINDRARRHAAG